MKILLATTNTGKVREIRLALAGAPVTLVTIDQALGAGNSAPLEPEETGRTFAENAALKANYYAQYFDMAAVAEDSGLSIDALGGQPGVLSARYPGATYADKFAGLYRELASHPRPWRARFVCSLAFVDRPDAGRVLFATEGVIEGEIAPEPRGSHGFGYDPIFFYPPLRMTTAEMPDDVKLAISHRGRAFAEFRRYLTASGGRRRAAVGGGE